MSRGDRWLVLMVVTILTGGIFLSLWLVWSLLERQNEANRAFLANVLDRTLGPTEQEQSRPVPPEVAYQTDLTEDTDLPVWAIGMTQEDLDQGIDPLTGRPLTM